ncbi:hypothetical protein J2Z50_002950 [Ensifer mexicanus]|nr:hypothetical protein [Sinorhizobium mexicanum]
MSWKRRVAVARPTNADVEMKIGVVGFTVSAFDLGEQRAHRRRGAPPCSEARPERSHDCPPRLLKAASLGGNSSFRRPGATGMGA